MDKDDVLSSDPLPWVKVDRAVKPKAVLLAGLQKSTYQHALGSLVEFWELCADPRELEEIIAKTPEGVEPEVVLPKEELEARFQLASGYDVKAEQLARLGLAEPKGDGGWRVRGMSRRFEPIEKRKVNRNNASKGGKASAEARKKRHGTAQPRSASRTEDAQALAQATPEASTEATLRSGSEASAERPPNQEDRDQSTDLDLLHPLPPEITGAAGFPQGFPQPHDATTHDGLEGNVNDWLRWAQHERTVRGWHDAPGDAVRALTRYLLGKHGPEVRPALERAFADFLDGWGAQEGRQGAWGLWLAPNVHEPRLADARVALSGSPPARRRRLNIVDAAEGVSH